ncbi:agmatinase [Rhodoferax sp. GW822-FHT02A01]|uniref:agmatinase n=1 Tax=Rhodoferax sp. GW822-FHT02A01 TaxID=3141537 RepID=UPI00315CFFE7
MTDPTTHGDSAITRSNQRGYEKENTFAGVLSFMRRQYTKDLSDAHVVVSGVPLDLATTYRSGARLGPAAIRAASVQMNEMLHPWGYGPCDRLSVIDYGDCWLDPHNPLTVFSSIHAHAQKILASGAQMLTLGGDHYITYPLLKAHAEQHGAPLSIIHFDAHCDTWADDEPLSLNHGSMFYKAIKDGLIDPQRSVQIGIRTWNEDFMGVQVLGADWVHEHGVAATVQKVRSIVGDHPTYLTFDIDCLDPAYAPGTGTPVAGGLSSAQALAILRKLVGLRWVGMDVVEVAPAYDHSDITALAAAQIAAEMLCLLAEQHASNH